nr:hypothetical protein [Natrinema sp. CBA1119]
MRYRCGSRRCSDGQTHGGFGTVRALRSLHPLEDVRAWIADNGKLHGLSSCDHDPVKIDTRNRAGDSAEAATTDLDEGIAEVRKRLEVDGNLDAGVKEKMIMTIGGMPDATYVSSSSSGETRHAGETASAEPATADESARAYAAAFRRRWGIETSYRQIGDFLPRTSSPTFSVRLFYFLFAVAMYNLWILANVLVSAGAVPEKSPISTRLFQEFVVVTDYG